MNVPAIVPGCLLFLCGVAGAAESAVGSPRIEADWLLQEELRGLPDRPALEADAAGAVDGLIDGTSGESYFHLDEVQVYRAGEDENIALGKPATQSGLSQWSKAHRIGRVEQHCAYPTEQVIARGLQLAEKLRPLGAKIEEQVLELARVSERLGRLAKDALAEQWRSLYLQLRWIVRRMALTNPLVDFDTILFTKRIPPKFPHMSDEYYGW